MSEKTFSEETLLTNNKSQRAQAADCPSKSYKQMPNRGACWRENGSSVHEKETHSGKQGTKT